MIAFHNVRKFYGATEAVKGISLNIAKGQLAVLIGPSGCGKTTTLKMINRLIDASEGTILLDGKDILEQNPEQLRRGIGYVIQSIGLFPHMTVQQNIQVVPKLLGWSKQKSAARADALLELIGLEPSQYRHSYPKELSGGQAQRVGVARALAVDPPVLLMDEPFGAVDPLTRERLQDEFLGLQKKLQKTIVMVTHDIDEAIRMGDVIAVMNDGKVAQFATPKTLLQEPADAFVRDFIGADRVLKRLSCTKARELVNTAIKEHTATFVYHDDDVRKALSIMLGQGLQSMAVVDAENQVLGHLQLEHILELAHKEKPEEGSA